MDFYAVLEHVLVLLQRHGRVSYRALKRQFDLDDEYLEDLKSEIIKVQQLAVDQDSEMLVWTGEIGTKPEPVSAPPAPQEVIQEAQHHSMPPITIVIMAPANAPITSLKAESLGNRARFS